MAHLRHTGGPCCWQMWEGHCGHWPQVWPFERELDGEREEEEGEEDDGEEPGLWWGAGIGQGRFQKVLSAELASSDTERSAGDASGSSSGTWGCVLCFIFTSEELDAPLCPPSVVPVPLRAAWGSRCVPPQPGCCPLFGVAVCWEGKRAVIFVCSMFS